MYNFSREELVALAKDFSEGSEELENILINLWDMGIETFACCKGLNEGEHQNGLIKIPYVSILITPENVKKVKTLMTYLSAGEKSSRPNMYVIKDDYNIGDRVSLLLDRICLTNQGCEQVLKNILSATESMKAKEKIDEKSADLSLVFDMMDEFLNRELYGYALFNQAKVKCLHNSSNPTFEMTGHFKFNAPLNEKNKSKILEELNIASVVVNKKEVEEEQQMQ